MPGIEPCAEHLSIPCRAPTDRVLGADKLGKQKSLPPKRQAYLSPDRESIPGPPSYQDGALPLSYRGVAVDGLDPSTSRL